MGSIEINHRGSYERYKSRTNVFINWLLNTARTCCKLDSIVLALKGRAGENAKKNGREVLLTTREITTLCLKIAEKKKAKIPGWLLPLLRTVIDGRTTAAEFRSTFSAAVGSDVERSNAGHAHFIEVLQQAHDIFSAIDGSRITTRPKKAAASSMTPLGNQFENLSMENPSETQLNQDELDELAQNTTGINFRLEVDEEQEILVQLMCLLSDTKLVREEIETTFKQFVDGDVTLEVTCQVANIGFGIIRRACEHFVSQRPSFKNYSCMLDFLGLRMTRHESLVVVQAEQVPKVHDPAISGGHQHRKLLIPLDEVTSSLLCVSGAAIMTGLYDASQRSSNNPVTHEIRHGFAKILHDALPELHRLDIRPSNLRPELGQWYSDEFASGMVNFLFGGHSGLPMWLAIIAHCYRNIHDILRGHMSCAAQAKARVWAENKKLISSFDNFKYCKGSESPCFPGLQSNGMGWFEAIRSMKGLEMVDEHTEFDLSFEPDTEVRIDTDIGAPMPNHLVKKLPTVGGVMMFEPTLLMHKFGCSIANTNWIVHCAAHLYAACHQTGLISQGSRWQDMDFFLERNKMYTHNVPGSSPWTMVSHFHLALGAQGRSLDKVKASSDQLNVKRPCGITAGSKLCQEYINILEAHESRGGGPITVVDAMLEAFTKADCPNLNLQGRYSTPKEITYTPSQLLVAMKDRLIEDEPVRHFNMIGFSQQCSTFLTEARQRTGVFVEAPQKPKTLHSPHDFTNVVLVEAAGALEAGIPASKTLLSTVSKALQSTIANSGDKYTKATYARSSGHLSFIEKPMINLMRFPSTAETRFTTFVRECLKKKPENWMVEDDTRGAAIYQVNGDPENFARLVKVYSVLKIWDQKRWANMAAQPLQSSKVGRYDEALVEGMRSWVQAGFNEDTVPAVLAMLLAVNCERATDKASENRVRELMVRLFRSSS